MSLAVAIGWAVVCLGASSLDSLDETRADLASRIAAERATLKALTARRTDVLALADELSFLHTESVRKVAALSARSKRFSAQRALAVQAEFAEQMAWERQARRLVPRLSVMYRLGRRDRLLDAKTIGTMRRRSRALAQWSREDLALLSEVAAAARNQQTMRRQLEAAERESEAGLVALKGESAIAALRREQLAAQLAALKVEAARSTQVVRELEQAGRQLDGMLQGLRSTGLSGAFRALKGRLPYPVRGIIEVGFGKVINPKFNTVVTQRGLDFRAPAGSPVISVAGGIVAYAGWLKGYGNLVIVDHGDGHHSLVAHLATVDVHEGDALNAGQRIGEVGETGSLKGPYLYFELRVRGEPVDPAPWLDELRLATDARSPW